MRALLVLALAALFATVAQAVTCQATARVLEERWKNCSAVVHGRLGALHPESLLDKASSEFVMNAHFSDSVDVVYSPCLMVAATGNTPSFLLQVSENDMQTQFVAKGVTAPTNDKVIEFVMPTQRGDVPHFVGEYTAVGSDSTATVTTYCNTTASQHMVMSGYKVTGMNKTSHYEITVQSIEACARFPYTNKSVPSGGVAALVILILCFVLEFGVCAWYHKNNKIETPFTAVAAEDLDAQEQ